MKLLPQSNTHQQKNVGSFGTRLFKYNQIMVLEMAISANTIHLALQHILSRLLWAIGHFINKIE
jgi:hypothetical protein